MAEADNKYVNGKIYELVYKDKRYIGSTTRTLEDRYNGHTGDCNPCASKELFDMAKAGGGIVVINLLEDYPCASRKELEARERFHIEHCQDVVNKRIPGRGWADYYQANKDKIIERVNAYYQANRDKVTNRRSVKIQCPCYVTYTQCHKARHEKSQHHINYLNRLKDTV